MPIYEVLVMKAGQPDKAGNVYTKKALKEVARQMNARIGQVIGQSQDGRPHRLVSTRLVETEDSAELYLRYEN